MTDDQLTSLEDALFRITVAVLAAVFLATRTWEVDLYSFEGTPWLLYVSVIAAIPTLLMSVGNTISQLRPRSVHYAGTILFLLAFILPDSIHLEGITDITVFGALACAMATVAFAFAAVLDVWDDRDPESLDV